MEDKRSLDIGAGVWGESDGREDKGSGNNSGEGDFEGWASRPGDLRQLPEAPGAPTVPKEKIHTVSQKNSQGKGH